MDRQQLGDRLVTASFIAAFVLVIVMALELGVAMLLAIFKILVSLWFLILAIALLAGIGIWLRSSPGQRPPDALA